MSNSSKPVRKKQTLEGIPETKEPLSGKVQGRKVTDLTDIPQKLNVSIPQEQEPESTRVKKKISVSKDLNRNVEEEQKVMEVFCSTTKKKQKGEITNTNLVQCFRKKEEDVDELIKQKGKFNGLSLLASERLQNPEPLSQKEIVDIYDLFFSMDVEESSNTQLKGKQDLVNPHSAYVFYHLFSGIKKITESGGFEKAKGASQKYCLQKPKPKDFSEGVEILCNVGPQQRASILENIKKQAKENDPGASAFLEAHDKYYQAVDKFEKGLLELPVIETRDLFKNRENINETYVLRGKTGNNQWICKPVGGKHDHSQVPQAECAASTVNFHHHFPIPMTVMVEVDKGLFASMQLFVSETKTIEEVQNSNLPLNQKDLQKLIIFDIIFANEDRHLGNILSKGLDATYGIDHDRCMMMGKIE